MHRLPTNELEVKTTPNEGRGDVHQKIEILFKKERKSNSKTKQIKNGLLHVNRHPQDLSHLL